MNHLNHSEKLVQFFDENFNEKKCYDLSRKYQFIKRNSSKLQGYEFIKVMVIPASGISLDSLLGLCKRISKFNPQAKLSAQALCLRINDISSSRLMKGLFIELLLQLKNHLYSCEKLKSSMNNFKRVLIQDSSCITLNEKLEAFYKGTKRASANIKAQMKVDLIYDLINGCTVDASLFNGNDPDQGLTGRFIKFLESGDLIIRDLGYFSIVAFRAINELGAYFLSRLMPRVHFYLNKTDETPLDIGIYLANKKYAKRNVIEIKGYLGKEKVPVRLVIYRQPPEVTNKRIREATKYGRNRNMSKSKLLCMQFSMFVTNVPLEFLSTNVIGTIYRLRWEIELVFKRWKNQLEIDHLTGIKRERIDCLIWSRLCTVLIIELVSGYFRKIAEERYLKEFSEMKFIEYLLREDSFYRALQSDRLEIFFKEIEVDIPRMLLKDKRRRKTMRERVYEQEGYYFTYVLENQLVA